jgi:hypothetical protein
MKQWLFCCSRKRQAIPGVTTEKHSPRQIPYPLCHIMFQNLGNRAIAIMLSRFLLLHVPINSPVSLRVTTTYMAALDIQSRSLVSRRLNICYFLKCKALGTVTNLFCECGRARNHTIQGEASLDRRLVPETHDVLEV